MTDGASDPGELDPGIAPRGGREGFDVLAIGASAGGIAALSTVLGGLPHDIDVPILIVQHLDRRHQTVIAEVLGRRAVMSVKLAEDAERARPGVAYVAPPNHHLLVGPGGILRLTESELVHFVRPSADLLFESVAGAYGDGAIAVVLTGTGTDGAMGVRAVKQRGGTVIVEDPVTPSSRGCHEPPSRPAPSTSSSRWRRSPKSSAGSSSPVGSGRCDERVGGRTRPPAALHQRLTRHRLRRLQADIAVPPYPQADGRRRAQEYDDYSDLLETNSDEFRFLLDAVLINVTEFFRDARAWEYLRAEIVPDIVERAARGEIRMWSAGCSSGEEACSLAMILAEVMGVEAFSAQVKIYATDIDEDALREARHGTYPAKSLEAMPADLAERYFEPSGTSFAFRPDLRRRIIYGRHDVTSDAPISRLHLLSCRNTMMYFNAETQSQIFDRFHFALRERGTLFLGKAEMLLSGGDRFEAISMPNRIFRRRPGIRGYQAVALPVRLDVTPAASGTSRQRELRYLTIDNAPIAHVLFDVNGSVVLVNNQARAMLGLTPQDEDRPLRELELSYRPVELRSLIEQAQSERRIVRRNAVERALSKDDSQYLDVQVQPLISGDGMVLGVDVSITDATAFVQLQQDFKRSREDLETAYEELQSTNEELETTNEELQSSIEELETTNEELQSTNEELETMNEELRARTSELDDMGGFLHAVLTSVPVGLVVLDTGLRVRSWNAAAQDLWGLRPDEAERELFFTVDIGLPSGQLRDPVRACLEDGRRQQIDVEAVNRVGRTIMCLIGISPLGESQHGVVISMEERRVG